MLASCFCKSQKKHIKKVTLLGMLIKFLLKLNHKNFRWNDSFPGTSVRHLLIALILSPSSGNPWSHRFSRSGEWSGRVVTSLESRERNCQKVSGEAWTIWHVWFDSLYMKALCA
ncbi:hypothetical protein CapIbe_013638 [Capra ibex]